MTTNQALQEAAERWLKDVEIIASGDKNRHPESAYYNKEEKMWNLGRKDMDQYLLATHAANLITAEGSGEVDSINPSKMYEVGNGWKIRGATILELAQQEWRRTFGDTEAKPATDERARHAEAVELIKRVDFIIRLAVKKADGSWKSTDDICRPTLELAVKSVSELTTVFLQKQEKDQ